MSDRRCGWKRVALGDVVEVVTDYWDRDASIPERFVAGEHIDEGDLHVRRWGMTCDDLVPPTFNRRFQAGDILFHSRNLRKLAQPDFGGITGEKIFVLRSRDTTVLLQDILPFVLKTQDFDDYANRMWAGSTNKFLNKAPLMNYEVALPPLEEQGKIATLLRAANDVCDGHQLSATTAELLFLAMLEKLFACGAEGNSSQMIGAVPYAASWPIVPLGNLATVERGKFSHRPRNLPEFFGGKYPFIQVTDIATSIGTLGPPAQYLSEIGVKYSRSFPPGTVLISITGAVLAKTAITNTEVWTPDSIVGIVPGKAILPEFLEFALRRLYPLFNGSLATKSTTQKNINLETLRPLPIPCPNLNVQRDIASHLQDVQSATFRHKLRAKDARRLLKVLSDRALSFGVAN